MALLHVPAQARFWLMAAGGLTFDLWSKDWAFGTLKWGEKRVVLPHVLEFQTMLNDGALFGIGSGLTSLFLIASMLALALVFWMFTQSGAKRWVLHLALGAILAGALGNMYDRVFVRLVRYSDHPGRTSALPFWTIDGGDVDTVLLTRFPVQGEPVEKRLARADAARLDPPVGYVRDFIKIPTTFWDRELWPWVFNIADTLLVCGVAILAIGLWREQRPMSESDEHDFAPAAGSEDADRSVDAPGAAAVRESVADVPIPQKPNDG